MKSTAVRPCRGLPFLSVTPTVSTTSFELTEMVYGLCVAEGVFCSACCAAPETAREKRRIRRQSISRSKPHTERNLDTAHRVCAGRNAELRTINDCVPTCIGDMIQEIGEVSAEIEVPVVVKSKRSA